MKQNCLISIWVLIGTLLLPSACSGSQEQDVQANESIGEKIPKAVIFDTDMCLDVDDVGALATLHVLADHDEAEILAVVFNEVHKDGAAAIDAINTWYNRGDIPIGIYKKELEAPDSSPYLSFLAEFPNDIPGDNSEVPSALDVYVKSLQSQPDSSVTIISVGFLNNLGDLLESHEELIAKKVQSLVIMAGINNDGFNLVRHGLVESSQRILTDWPTPIVISQPGGDIMTGETLASTPQENPVREAYYRWFDESYKGRSSWDQIAVLFAVKGPGLFAVKSTGSGSLKNGFSYDMEPGWRSFITEELSNEEYVHILNKYMTALPELGDEK